MNIEQLQQICKEAEISFPEHQLVDGFHIWAEEWNSGYSARIFYHLYDETGTLLDIQTSRKPYIPVGNARPMSRTNAAIQGTKGSARSQADDGSDDESEVKTPRKRGRPAKVKVEGNNLPRKRGRPPKSSARVVMRKKAQPKMKKVLAQSPAKKPVDFNAFHSDHQKKLEELRARVQAFVSKKK